jgi:hypothetical protein
MQKTSQSLSVSFDFPNGIIVYGTIILSVVLYGYETWYRILTEEHRLRVFGSRVLRNILGLRVFGDRVLRNIHGLRVFGDRGLRNIHGPKREEETGCWRKLHNEELHDLSS